MNYKKIALQLILPTALIITSLGFTQTVYVDVATERGLMSKSVSAKVNASGSPYIEEDFKPVRIKGYDNQIYSGRYNGYNGEMEINLGGDKLIALDTNAEVEVIFTTTNKVYKTFSYETDRGYTKRGFLAVVDEGENYSLLKEEIIKYYEGEKATSSYERDKPAKFRREDDKYYLSANGETKFLPQREKDLLKAFPKNSKAIKGYIKSNKLKTKKEEDLTKVAAYIATL
ncbi:MAG: hypothetical protein HKN99_04200 [Winogradskyella sp.]|nr:hypothetical protein [Winogradskyella sp.]MBT8376765.1 hypothetical protein [Bacteroidia bacterium]NNC45064.1 hypothetical protein [Winogradskyella sp.]NNF85050.1 hypothetical protein [Winogradskyella sp.]NNK40098.1 hypothetical protein [Winogradskyella sp.]